MRPAAERRIRVRFEHTRYGHWGRRSGYACLPAHLDPLRFQAETHAAADSDEEIPPWLRPAKPLLARALRRGAMKWYKLSDLSAEFAALRRCLGGHVDLVHFLDGEHSGRFLPRLLRAAGSKVRTVATFHQPPRLLEELVDPALVRRFDHIVLVSPSQRPYFEARAPEARLSVILHGVDTAFFRPRRGDRPPGPFRCVTAGHWLRDWRVFRRVAEQLADAEFHVVAGQASGAEDLPNVTRHSGIDDDALAALYRSADALFLPLQDATANNALLEGMATGLPVVATDLPAVRAYLGGDAVLIPPGEPDAAVAGLLRLREDAGLQHRLGLASRARARSLRWQRIAPLYESLFARLVMDR